MIQRPRSKGLPGAAWLMFCIAAPTGLPAEPIGTSEGEFFESPLPVAAVPAFEALGRWRRPTVIACPPDGSRRLMIASQYGTIYVIPNDPEVRQRTTFLDIESRVTYKDSENEEGLLGMAFHPRFADNGEFYLYYTTSEVPHVSIVSRFHVSRHDPDLALPDSETEILRIQQPFWNHNGGTLAFGPDGYLYIGLGDGGSAGDPQGNGQNLSTWLGSILRIDVDQRSDGAQYGIPADNPFVSEPQARPEIWAYGLRNVWRLSFDRQTGQLWAGDVGQDLWEEINLIQRGGNYGWNVYEGRHRYRGKQAVNDDSLPEQKYIEPIWEYHHDIGKSITGGVVYRGREVPELIGCYLYADYVAGQLWALKYDVDRREVLANYRLEGPNNPYVTYGEDHDGEVLVTDAFGNIFRFQSRSR